VFRMCELNCFLLHLVGYVCLFGGVNLLVRWIGLGRMLVG